MDLKGQQLKMLAAFLVMCFVATTAVAQSTLFSSDEPVVQLYTHNFSSVIHNSPKMWIVDFYAAWCGYCQRLAPEYSAMAQKVQGWSSVVGVAAVACSEAANSALCRTYGVNGYPTIKFFPPHTTDTSRGHLYEGDKFAAGVYKAVLQYLNLFVKEGKTDQSWPSLSYLRNANRLWLQNGVQEAYVVMEDNHMISNYVGLAVILDSLDLRPRVAVGRMNISDTAEPNRITTPGLYRLTSFGLFEQVLGETSQEKLSQAVRLQSRSQVQVEETHRATAKPVKFDPSTYRPPRGLHMQDLESSLYYSLFVEIPAHDSFEHASLQTLKNYINILAKYHPGEPHIKKFLNNISHWLSGQHGRLTSQTWLQKLKQTQSQDGYLYENLRWTGCNGSLPHLRGYPCSLWMTFHTLTVNAYLKEIANVSFNPHEILLPIREYVRHFFTCRPCAANFVRGSQNLEQTQLAARDVILWLWRIHNWANSRLHGDVTEDPFHPKVQFPPPESCPSCRNSSAAVDRFDFNTTSEVWNEDRVAAYLIHFYRQDNIFDDDVDRRGNTVADSSHSGTTRGSTEAPKPRPDAACRAVYTDWTPCSHTCDTGTSTRMVRSPSTGCELKPEVRLCLVRPCSTQFPSWSNSQRDVANCPRHGHTYRMTRPVTLTFGNCSTSRPEHLRVCGKCPTTSRSRRICCHPGQSETQPRDVTCSTRRSDGRTESAAGSMMVEVINYCICDHNCSSG